MIYRAVVFDLYGTLVPPFPRAAHTAAVHETAAILGLDATFCHDLWRSSYERRVAGEFGSMPEYFAWFGTQGGREVTPEAAAAAAAVYADFTRASLQPLPGVVNTLAALRARNLDLGLLTNCTPDVAALFPATALGPHFSHTVFSAIAKTTKPAPAAYAAVLAGLTAAPREILYVGDGSDGELTGAEAAGMTALLVTPSLHDTYDQHRPEVENWRGARVATIPEVFGFIGC